MLWPVKRINRIGPACRGKGPTRDDRTDPIFDADDFHEAALNELVQRLKIFFGIFFVRSSHLRVTKLWPMYDEEGSADAILVRLIFPDGSGQSASVTVRTKTTVRRGLGVKPVV